MEARIDASGNIIIQMGGEKIGRFIAYVVVGNIYGNYRPGTGYIIDPDDGSIEHWWGHREGYDTPEDWYRENQEKERG